MSSRSRSVSPNSIRYIIFSFVPISPTRIDPKFRDVFYLTYLCYHLSHTEVPTHPPPPCCQALSFFKIIYVVWTSCDVIMHEEKSSSHSRRKRRRSSAFSARFPSLSSAPANQALHPSAIGELVPDFQRMYKALNCSSAGQRKSLWRGNTNANRFLDITQ